MSQQADNTSHDDDTTNQYPSSAPVETATNAPPSPLRAKPTKKDKPEKEDIKMQVVKRPFHQFFFTVGDGISNVTSIIGLVSPIPATLENECGKAARILRRFTGDGEPLTILSTPTTGQTPKRRKHKTYRTIRQDELRNAQGLVILSFARAGFMAVGPTLGSGIVVVRLPDNSWSPPAPVEVGSLAFPFNLSLGFDLVEAVMVLPTPEAVESFKCRHRLSFGFNGGVALGPFGIGGGCELISGQYNFEQMPTMYMRNRGLSITVTTDARCFFWRTAAGEVFYGKEGITIEDILDGRVPRMGPSGRWPEGARPLKDVLVQEAGPCHWEHHIQMVDLSRS